MLEGFIGFGPELGDFSGGLRKQGFVLGWMLSENKESDWVSCRQE